MKFFAVLALSLVLFGGTASCTNTCTEFVDLVAARKNGSCPSKESVVAIKNRCTGNKTELERLASLLQTCKKVRESSL